MTLFRPLIAAASALALTACAVGPRYQTPNPPPPAYRNADPASFQQAAFEAQWWRQFGDPVLDELEARALAGNLDLRIAAARVREARALFRDTQLDLAPRVTTSATYSAGRTPQPHTDLPPLTGETWQAGFDATWEVDLFGHVRHTIEAAHADAGAAEAELRGARVAVAAEVARNYFEYRGARARLAVAQRNLETERETLRLTQTRFDVGQGDAGDVASAEAVLKATEASIPAFTIAAKQAGYRLAVLLGQRPGAVDDLLAPEKESRPLIKPLPIGDAATLLRRRPDVQAAERRLAGETARTGVATADLFPRLQVGGFLGFLSGDLSGLGDGASRMWSVAPTLVWPGLDFLGARARLRAQEARGDAAAATYDETVLQAIEDLENALVGYSQEQASLRSLVDRVAASRRAAELARVRYKEGATDFLTLLDAERNLLAAEDAASAAETAVNVRVVAVYKALGGGWDV